MRTCVAAADGAAAVQASHAEKSCNDLMTINAPVNARSPAPSSICRPSSWPLLTMHSYSLTKRAYNDTLLNLSLLELCTFRWCRMHSSNGFADAQGGASGR